MQAARRPLASVLVILAMVLAGCVGPGGPSQLPPADRGEDAPGNDLLLDGPRPAAASDVSHGAEPIVLVDQAGDWIAVADTSGIHVSTDDGSTWETPYVPWTGGLFRDGISLAQDDQGTLYAANTNGQTIQVARTAGDPSENTWERGQFVVDAAPVADRPWLAARDDGKLALVFYDFGRTFQEYCLQSFDGGDTFPDRSVAPLGPPPNAGNVVFTDDASLFWAVGGTLYHRPAVDSLGEQRACTSTAYSHQVFADTGPQVFTQVDTDGQRVLLAAPTDDSAGIQVASAEGFTDVRRLTLTPTDGTDALLTNTFVAISTTPDEVAVAWYGSETDGNPTSSSFDGAWNVYTARIERPLPGGDTVTCDSANVRCDRLTTDPNHVGPICMAGISCSTDRDLLDYFGTDHGPDGALHVAYGDDWEGTAEDGEAISPAVRYAQLAPIG